MLFRSGREEGLREGIKKGQNNLISAMIQNGVTVEQISTMTGLSYEEIESRGLLIKEKETPVNCNVKNK